VSDTEIVATDDYDSQSISTRGEIDRSALQDRQSAAVEKGSSMHHQVHQVIKRQSVGLILTIERQNRHRNRDSYN
jgi:hypothetical protein